MGQEFSGYAAQLEAANRAIENSLDQLLELSVGGTAVGTGINSKEGYADKMATEISDLTGYSFKSAPNKFSAMAAHDAVVGTSGTLKTLAAALMKISNDPI